MSVTNTESARQNKIIGDKTSMQAVCGASNGSDELSQSRFSCAVKKSESSEGGLSEVFMSWTCGMDYFRRPWKVMLEQLRRFVHSVSASDILNGKLRSDRPEQAASEMGRALGV